jgi:hypothetical protein
MDVRQKAQHLGLVHGRGCHGSDAVAPACRVRFPRRSLAPVGCASCCGAQRYERAGNSHSIDLGLAEVENGQKAGEKNRLVGFQACRLVGLSDKLTS